MQGSEELAVYTHVQKVSKYSRSPWEKIVQVLWTDINFSRLLPFPKGDNVNEEMRSHSTMTVSVATSYFF